MPRGGAGGQCGDRGHVGARAGPPRPRGHEPVRQQLVSMGSYYLVISYWLYCDLVLFKISPGASLLVKLWSLLSYLDTTTADFSSHNWSYTAYICTSLYYLPF